MSIQSKKKKSNSKSKTVVKKKPIHNKTIQKRKQRKSKKKSHLKHNIFMLLTFIFIVSLVAFGYYLGKKSEDESITFSEVFEGESSYTTKQLLDDLSKMKKEKIKIQLKKKEEEKLAKARAAKKRVEKESKIKEETKLRIAEAVKTVKPTTEVNQKIKKIKTQPKKIALTIHSKKPKLVIVIDDVSKRSQIRAIQHTGIKMTPSIFPPSELSMHSNHLADGLKHYMIHLPMESGSKQFNSQYKTLMTSFSSAQIENRAKELRRLFPHGHYVNNHTGSVFTSNLSAMKKLYKALRDVGFIFVDSLTTAKSKVRSISSIYGDTYVARDIFIDNIHTIDAIYAQLKKAVRVAKKKGYAIAIGHPHKITMQALKSANDILKDVELIYIDELYEEK